jgi:UDP-N-acetylglucosamine 1-carboxyvinyltransferase
VKSLGNARHALIPDRIEAGTLMAAAAITGGDLTIENVVPDHVKPVCAKLKEAGVEISEELTSIRVVSNGQLKAVDIKTHPHPGFPTDMQAQISSVMSTAKGTSMIIETIFENRFMHIGELKRMGARVKIEGRSAVIEGIDKLTGAEVKATDLRAGASLILAGLAAEGSTIISNVEHIDRGYEEIDRRLNNIGADIVRTR